MVKEKLKAMKRKTGKWHDILPIAVVWSVILSWTVFLIGATPLEKGFLSLFTKDEDTLEFLGLYFSFIKIWIVFVLLFLIKYNRPMLSQLALTKGGNTISNALFGFILGFLANAVCIFASALMGDIKLSYRGFNPILFVVFFISVFIQCGGEEIIDRLYLYQKLRRRYTFPAVAIAGSSAAFILNHLFAPGFSILPAFMIGGCGVLFALLVYYYDSFWAAIMFHTAWNFSQSIFFGLPNSGIVSSFSVFTIDVESARNGFFYDTEFGVEGSIGAVLIFVILSITVILINRGKGEKNDLWK